jgi:hypothetical protein
MYEYETFPKVGYIARPKSLGIANITIRLDSVQPHKYAGQDEEFSLARLYIRTTTNIG